jgi:hypothetical protein
MNKVIVSIITLGFFFLLSAADSSGFRNLKWGSSPDKLGKNASISRYDKDFDMISYQINNDKLLLGTTKLSGIHYIFIKNKLASVVIDFPEMSDFKALKGSLEASYGTCNETTEYAGCSSDFSGNTSLFLYSFQTGGKAVIGYNPLFNMPS